MDDRKLFAVARRHNGRGGVRQTQHQRGGVLALARQVWRDGGQRSAAVDGVVAPRGPRGQRQTGSTGQEQGRAESQSPAMKTAAGSFDGGAATG